MPDPLPDLAAVRRRLAGVALRTPLVGVTSLGARPAPAALRVKLECLQVGGSAWFRGAFHQLAAALGAHRGVVAHGAPRDVVAAATAASLQRIPTRCAVTAAALAAFGGEAALRAALGPAPGVAIDVAADAAAVAAQLEAARRQGLALVPPIGGIPAALDDPLFAAGLATIGVELAEDMPSDVETVLVAPAWLEAPVRAGLAFAGRSDCAVRGTPEAADDGWRDAVRIGLRCDTDVAAWVLPAAIAAAERAPAVAVLGA